MSYQKNVIYNYASQIYTTVLGLIMVPFYMQFMGAASYGLVGFFAMLQVWFNLLDMGLTPTVARESARYYGGAIFAMEYRRLVKSLEAVFFVIAILGTLFLYFMAEPIAQDWLTATTLSVTEITDSLKLMAIAIGLRWMSGLYRGVITGAERFAWLSTFNICIASIRFLVIVPLLIYVSNSAYTFFTFQLFVALIELVFLLIMSNYLLPDKTINKLIEWELSSLKPILKFSFSIAFTSSVWILVTQADKLVLSRLLLLEDYGYFTVAAIVSGGIMVVSTPISTSVMMRMAHLDAEKSYDELIRVYRNATQFVAILTMPIALLLIFFSSNVLWAWTGDAFLVDKVSSVLSLYSIGFAFLALSAFPYYLQYAKGILKYHIYGTSLLFLFLFPSIIWASQRFGMVGAGWAWLLSNFLYFILWTPVVHQKFIKGVHFKWLFNDIVRPFIAPCIAAYLSFTYLILDNENRYLLTLQLIMLLFFFMILSYLSVKDWSPRN